jgi:hypothetical protein
LDDATVQELMQLRQRLGTGIGDPADFRAALEQVARGPLADHHPVPSGGPTLAAAENGGLIPQTEFPQPAALANMGPRPGMSHHHRRAARALEEAAWELEWAGDYPWADQLRHQAAELYRRAR